MYTFWTGSNCCQEGMATILARFLIIIMGQTLDLIYGAVMKQGQCLFVKSNDTFCSEKIAKNSVSDHTFDCIGCNISGCGKSKRRLPSERGSWVGLTLAIRQMTNWQQLQVNRAQKSIRLYDVPFIAAMRVNYRGRKPVLLYPCRIRWQVHPVIFVLLSNTEYFISLDGGSWKCCAMGSDVKE